MGDQLQRYDESADNSPWINALAELRQRATREGHCYQHVQAITVAIDQYAERRWATAITFSTSPTAWGSAHETSAHGGVRCRSPLQAKEGRLSTPHDGSRIQAG